MLTIADPCGKYKRTDGFREPVPDDSPLVRSAVWIGGLLVDEKQGIGEIGKQGAHGHAKNLCEVGDAQIDHTGSLGLDAGDDVASHVAPAQLHFGREDVLRPVLLHPQPCDISSDDVGCMECLHLRSAPRATVSRRGRTGSKVKNCGEIGHKN